jgi:hypothetical protein
LKKTAKNNLVTLAKREENIRFFFFFAGFGRRDRHSGTLCILTNIFENVGKLSLMQIGMPGKS